MRSKRNAVILLLLLTTIVCRKADEPCLTCPPPYVQTVFLDTLSVDVTEVLLRVRGTDTSGAVQLALYRDSLLVYTGQPARGDTTVLDTALAPARLYTYKVYRLTPTSSGQAGQPANQPTDSTQLVVRTMDSTSHNFIFQIDTLGDGSSSVLYDVAIINDTLVYAVGAIYLRDSVGNWDPNAYNMAKWNGQRWEPMRIQFYTICPGGSDRTPYPAKAVFAFSETDVWIAMDGSQMARWNGTTQTATICNPDPFVINKIWGENPNSIWAVGYGGRIGHYTSGTWQRVESGTTLPINDVWGARSLVTGGEEVLCVASNQFINQGKRLLRIESAGVTQIPDSGLSWDLSTVWHVPARRYFIGGDGLYHSRSLGPIWYRDVAFPPYYKTAIRGVGLRDIVVVGAFGLLMHFNGVTWQNFQSITYMASGSFTAVEIKGNLIVAVGGVDNRAVVARGMR